MVAKGELEAAVPLATRIKEQIIAGDSAGAKATFVELRSHADSAAALTSDPIWLGAEAVPYVGPNLKLVGQLASIVNEVTVGAIEPLVGVADTVDISSFKPVDGVLQLRPLLDAAPLVETAASAMTAAAHRAATLDSSDSLPVLQEATSRLQAVVREASDAAEGADRAVKLIPEMLGSSGPRNYLVMFQNPAELRSGGGIPGALALIHTESGHIDMVQQASSADFSHFETPVLDLPTDTRGIYGDITGEYIQDVTLTPQFPQAAALAREMWTREFGVEVDGVLSADPVMVSYLLDATGPVNLGGGETLTAQNAVQVLLSDAYARFPHPRDQDAFFAAAAKAVFSRLSSGQLDPAKLVAALARAGEEGRVLVWSAHPEDQAVLQGTTLTGDLPVSDADVQKYGVYLNDATGAKMDFYLTTAVAVGQAVCRQDGRVTVAADITLTSTAPSDAAALPEYVTGRGAFGVQPGNIRTLVYVYSPKGSINQAVIDPKDLAVHTATDSEYPVTSFEIELAPGETKTIRVSSLLQSGFTGAVDAVTTPGINTLVTRELSRIC